MGSSSPDYYWRHFRDGERGLAPIWPMIPPRNWAARIAASQIRALQIAPRSKIPACCSSTIDPRMDRTPSKPMAALWMAGWLALMLIIAIAGRELNVFQLMLMRSAIGLCLLYPLIHRSGGFAVVKTSRLPQHIARNSAGFTR